jgi:hypothetical protein
MSTHVSMPQSPLLTNVFTARGERAAAIGLWGATTGVGFATGPIIGGERQIRAPALLSPPRALAAL